MADYSEAEMIADFLIGAEKAFNWVYGSYYKKLFVFCFNLTQNTQESQDIAIVCLSKLFDKHKLFNNYQDMGSFLFVAARNNCLNYLRNQKIRSDKHRQILAESKAQGQEDPLNDQLDMDFVEAVKKYVDELPERSGQVIDMIYFRDMSYEQIAEKMQITISTVGNHRSKALNNLRKNMPDKELLIQTGILTLLSFFKW